MPTNAYLGDGVEAEYDGYMIRLSTQRATGEHVIYLESQVYAALVRYARACGWETLAEED